MFLKGKTWQLRIEKAGRTRQISLGVGDRAKAEAKAELALEALRSGWGVDQAKVKAVALPLNDVWTAFESKASCSAKTLGDYRHLYNGAQTQILDANNRIVRGAQ